MLGGIVAFFKGLAIALGWMKQASDQETGVKLEAGEVAQGNLAVTQAELKASTDAPKTEDEALQRLKDGTA